MEFRSNTVSVEVINMKEYLIIPVLCSNSSAVGGDRGKRGEKEDLVVAEGCNITFQLMPHELLKDDSSLIPSPAS